jgi:hypothetical protein
VIATLNVAFKLLVAVFIVVYFLLMILFRMIVFLVAEKAVLKCVFAIATIAFTLKKILVVFVVVVVNTIHFFCN